MKVLEARFAGKALEILVDKIPKDLKYKRYGNDIYAEKDGYVSHYFLVPRSKGGFANRSIKINVDGFKEVFKGTLWDADPSDPRVPKYERVRITDDPIVMERGYTFYSGKITEELFDKILINNIGEV